MKGGVVVALALVACGSSDGNLDAGHLLDGHVENECSVDEDCATSKKCVRAICNPRTHACDYPDVVCMAPDGCHASSCNALSGECDTTTANDGMSCSTPQNVAGVCNNGVCLPIPTCWSPMSFSMLACDNKLGGEDLNNNLATPFGPPPTQQTSKYGSCATNETAPEVAYSFVNNGTSDGDVTVHLFIQGVNYGAMPSDGGVPDGGADMAVPGPHDVDLDLIVIEGACQESSPCANPPLPGGGFQGITPGTGNETVTFHAKAGVQYFIVVDGKNGATASYEIRVEACGACQPTPKSLVGCDQSMDIPGNTAGGSAKLSAYSCASSAVDGGTTAFSAAGNEQIYYFPPVTMQREVHATVSGASQPVTLAVLPDNASAQCDPTICVAGAVATGSAPKMGASVTFTAQSSFGNNTPYWIVVDTPAGQDTSYGLSIECH